MNTIQSVIHSKKSAHWYYLDGNPCWEVPNKSKPGETRKPTSTDAKKLGLYGSVTTILKDIRKHGLEDWKNEQLLMAALTEPARRPEESEREWIVRIINTAQEQSDAAMKFGSEIHKLIEDYIATREVALLIACEQRISDTIRPVYDFLDKHGFHGEAEKMVVNHEHKYAGTMDFIGEAFGISDVIVDFKTQSTKPGKKVIYYDEWIYQLAAYGICFVGPRPLVSVVISSTEPGRIEYKIWSSEDADWGFTIFKDYAHAFNTIRGII